MQYAKALWQDEKGNESKMGNNHIVRISSE